MSSQPLDQSPTGARGPLIHVVTRCASVDEFVDKFAAWASPGTLILPASGELPIGTEGRFAIRLNNQVIAMRGRCRVTEARSVPAATGQSARRTFLRVALLEMDEQSAAIHRRLIAQRNGGGVPIAISAAPSDPTVVSPPRPDVPAPPTTRPPPPPPLAALAATIAMRPLPRRATSPLGVPRLPPSAVTAQLRPETRVPGAPFTLPANPLSEMNPADLASFIESTLLETEDDDATAERPGEPGAAAPAAGPSEAAAPASSVAPAIEPTEPTVVDSHPERPMATPLVQDETPPSERARRVGRRLLPYALCAITGILIGHAVWRPAGPRSAAPAVQSRPAEPPAAPVIPAAASAPVAPPAEIVAPPAPAPPPAEAPARVAAPGTCLAGVATEPAGARVTWLGKSIGRTPIVGAPIPCGAGALTITHERYEPVTRSLLAVVGNPVALSERLHRPPATLNVSSAPAGATVSLNGHPVGATPRSIQTWRYEHVSVRVQLAGYAPWTKKIYLRGATTKLAAQLVSSGRGR